jgi:hypothetical protein
MAGLVGFGAPVLAARFEREREQARFGHERRRERERLHDERNREKTRLDHEPDREEARFVHERELVDRDAARVRLAEVAEALDTLRRRVGAQYSVFDADGPGSADPAETHGRSFRRRARRRACARPSSRCGSTSRTARDEPHTSASRRTTGSSSRSMFSGWPAAKSSPTQENSSRSTETRLSARRRRSSSRRGSSLARSRTHRRARLRPFCDGRRFVFLVRRWTPRLSARAAGRRPAAHRSGACRP